PGRTTRRAAWSCTPPPDRPGRAPVYSPRRPRSTCLHARRYSMGRRDWIGVFLIALAVTARGLGGEPGCCGPAEHCFLKGWQPAGGRPPYGGGLLHWWTPHCFPNCGAPDDYGRKVLPRACWPAYPPYYTWGPPESCCTPIPER